MRLIPALSVAARMLAAPGGVLAAPFAAATAAPANATPGSTTAAPDVSMWRIGSLAPFAVRGGIVAVELSPADPRSPESQPSGWPQSLPMKRDDGTVVDAALAVILPAAPRPAPSWPQPVDDVRVITPTAFAALLAEGPLAGQVAIVALARFEEAFAGSFELAGARISPRWLDPDPSLAIASAPEAAGLRVEASGPGRPDAQSPGEYWRWVLLAQELDKSCAPPPFDRVGALYARHRAELWTAGLARIRSESASVAKDLRELLTARVRDPARDDGDGSVAAWVSQPAELSALLSILLDPQRSPASSMRAALGWMESRSPLTVWLESDAGGVVEIAAANPLPQEVVVRCAWLEAPKEAPLALLVPAHAVGRMRIERPEERASNVPGRGRGEPAARWLSGLTLRLECGTWNGRMLVGPGSFPVRPPGLGFASFVPALTLAAAQSQRLEPVAAPWRTTASIRRMGARWELFFECLRPTATADDHLEITIWDPLPAPVSLSIDERGSITMLEGTRPEGLAAHAHAFADRWRVRVELPISWIPGARLGEVERPLRLSIERRPGAEHGRQTAALAVPSWRPAAPIRADLGAWSEMPGTAAR